MGCGNEVRLTRGLGTPGGLKMSMVLSGTKSWRMRSRHMRSHVASSSVPSSSCRSSSKRRSAGVAFWRSISACGERERIEGSGTRDYGCLEEGKEGEEKVNKREGEREVNDKEGE
jgi:hypothetical protein